MKKFTRPSRLRAVSMLNFSKDREKQGYGDQNWNRWIHYNVVRRSRAESRTIRYPGFGGPEFNLCMHFPCSKFMSDHDGETKTL